MTVELRHLRAFVAIAEEGNVTRAASRLHVTQPALSRTLAQLEAHLGVRLIDRSTHHLELTQAGGHVLARAQAALSAVDDVLDPARAVTWTLRLGHSWAGLARYTVPVLRAWQRRHPQVPLQLRRFDDHYAGLLQGKVDASVVRQPRVQPGVATELLFREPRRAALPADCELAAAASLTLADLAGWPVVMNRLGGSTTLSLWPSGAGPGEVIEVVNTDDWLTTIAAGRGVGISTVATEQMHQHPGVVYRRISDAPEVEVHLAWRLPPTHSGVADLLDVIVASVRSEG